ncbi:MAG: hypothetical protein AAFW73_07220 [Bacteroidota bacterium]
MHTVKTPSSPPPIQSILLDQQGHVVESCDTIFTVAQFQGPDLTAHFPLVESIFPQLCELSLDGPTLHFPGVETSLEALPGFYDFTFSRQMRYQQSLLHWCIRDRTAHYTALQGHQQARNEWTMQREWQQQANRGTHPPSDE